MRECCFEPSNPLATQSLPEYLRENNVVAIDGVDTRKITKLLRVKGALRCVISTEDGDHDSLVRKARAVPDMAGSDLVKDVTVTEPYDYPCPGEARYRVVALDFGIKENILRLLASAGCAVTVVPASTPAEDILARDPDGIFLSNGPGDPAALPYVFPEVQKLMDSGKPLFGICLGHQILAHALGGKTYKLKFGHRGGNQPVQFSENGRVEITAQNHGFAVDADSLDPASVAVTHTHLNDQTCSGLAHTTKPIFGVQYHPESSPGPHDSRYLFQRFTDLMDRARAAAV
jgi:carbamoyl-phosphate synthase small subunit